MTSLTAAVHARTRATTPAWATYPSPRELGFPYDSWRPGQEAVLEKMLAAETRFIVLAAPTGTGKSLLYSAWARVSGWERWAVLTATRGLQDQLGRDFSDLTDVRGMANYPCIPLMKDVPRAPDGGWIDTPWSKRCDRGPCLGGGSCDYRHGGCYYYDAVKRATSRPQVVTNYAFWLQSYRKGMGIGTFDVVVLDETHDAPDEVCRAVAVEVTEYDRDYWSLPDWPEGARSGILSDWRDWAEAALRKLPHDDDKESPLAAGDVRRLRGMRAALGTIRNVPATGWVVEVGQTRGGGETATFAPVWPKEHAAGLWQLPGAKRVVLASATITPKVLDLLGIPEREVTWIEAESPFPVRSRLVVYVPTVRVDARTDYMRRWVQRIDQIIDGRQDRKGIVHTTSYERARALVKESRHRRILISHDSAKGLADAVSVFKAASPPAVLVSPSIVSGYDFPGDQCEYQVVGKIPFADTRAGLAKERAKDRDWGYYSAAQQIVQAVGRGVRTPEDVCETFVIDDHWVWFRKKARRHMPRWFRLALREATMLPKPPARSE